MQVTYFDEDIQGRRQLHLFLKRQEGGTAEDSLRTLRRAVHEMRDSMEEAIQAGALPEGTAIFQMGMLLEKLTCTVTDRGADMLKLAKMLEGLKEEHVKSLDSYEALDDAAKAEATKVVVFFCNYHVLHSVVERISASAETWSGIHFAAGPDCTVYDYVRQACKAIAPGANEQCGVQAQFEEFVAGREGGAARLRAAALANFRGERFGILLRDGAGLWLLYEDFLAFSASLHKAKNKLIQELDRLYAVPELKAQLHALAVVYCQFYLPFERFTLDDKGGGASSMVEFIKGVRLTLCKLKDEPAGVIDGSQLLFPALAQTNTDLWRAVMRLPADGQQAGWVLQLVQLHLNSILAYVELVYMQLLPEGTLSGLSVGDFREAPKTNLVNEHAYGCLDQRLQVIMRSATTIAVEGNILFRLNGTLNFLAKLPPDQLAALTCLAVSSRGRVRANYNAQVEEDRQLAAQRAAEHEQRARTAQEKKAAQKDAAVQAASEAPGGVWRTVEDVDAGLLTVAGNAEQLKKLAEKSAAGVGKLREVLKAQLAYQQTVLGRPGQYAHSSNGKQHSWVQLKAQLVGVLQGAAGGTPAAPVASPWLRVRDEEQQQTGLAEQLAALQQRQVPQVEQQRQAAQAAAAAAAAKEAAREQQRAERAQQQADAKAAKEQARAAKAAATAAAKAAAKAARDQAKAAKDAASAAARVQRQVAGGAAKAPAQGAGEMTLQCLVSGQPSGDAARVGECATAGAVPQPARIGVVCGTKHAEYVVQARRFVVVAEGGQEQLMTGPEFEEHCGRGKSKNWKVTVKVDLPVAAASSSSRAAMVNMRDYFKARAWPL